MSESCTKPDERWLTLMNETSAWFDSPAGQQLLDQERRVIGQELSRCFGSYLVHYGPFANAAIEPQKVVDATRLRYQDMTSTGNQKRDPGGVTWRDCSAFALQASFTLTEAFRLPTSIPLLHSRHVVTFVHNQ